MELAQIIEQLDNEGFSLDYALKVAFEEDAATKGLDDTGPYVIDAAFRKGLVTLKFERNTAIETSVGGQQVTVQYTPVCVVEGPRGRVACPSGDLDLIVRMAGELA